MTTKKEAELQNFVIRKMLTMLSKINLPFISYHSLLIPRLVQQQL